MMAVIDVGLNYICSDITNRAKKFSRTPKMAFTKMSTQPRMLTKKLERATTFQELESFSNTHNRRKTNKNMHMVGFDLQLENFDVVSVSNFAQKLFAMVANKCKLKGISSILRFPYKMEHILSNTMSILSKSFHFYFPPRFFLRSSRCSYEVNECASYATHSFHYHNNRSNLRRLGTRAKARGILCM